jgi:hypothetical protein
MRTHVRIAFLACVALLLAHRTSAQALSPPQTAGVCLNGTDIEYTQTPNDQTVVFHMRDGKVWRNTLKTPCPNLKFEHAFSETIRGGQICANQQIIRVQQTGNFCALGDFTLIGSPRPMR